MHTFQPYPIDMLNMNPFTKIGSVTAATQKNLLITENFSPCLSLMRSTVMH